MREAKFPVNADTQDAKAMEALSTVWFKADAGLDVYVTDHVFMRGALLYGVRLTNKMEKQLLDTRQEADSVLGHGGDFKIAFGYRF
jgi:hypothetical protein